MATSAKPVLDADTARQIIDPASYASWDPLLDTFDRHCPVGAALRQSAAQPP